MITRLKPLLALFKLSSSLTTKECDENFIEMFDDGSGLVITREGKILTQWVGTETSNQIEEKIMKAIKSRH